jgi:transcriptional regulator with XRE-family HTH domain
MANSQPILAHMSKQGADETLGRSMRFLRQGAGATLDDVAHALGTSKGHLSNTERGRDRPSVDIIAFYEERFHGDGQLWSTYVESLTSPRPRQRARNADRPSYPIAGDASSFVADITVPDGTVMPPGFIFEKVWRICNVGTVPWIGRWLARDGAPSGPGIPQSPPKVRINDTMPDEEVDIAVPVRAHPLDGTSQARWKMVDDDGWEFFPDRYPYGIFMTIVVRAGTPEPRIRRL